MSRDPKPISPYQALAKAIRADRERGGRAPNFSTNPHCMTCKLARNYGGVGRAGKSLLLFDIKATGTMGFLKTILHELPINGSPNTWSHCGTINAKASAKAGMPTPDWASLCPACHQNNVLEELAEFAAIANKQRAAPGRLVLANKPHACRDCGTTRDGIELDMMARWEDGPSMGSVTLIELDPKGWDFRPGWQKRAEHWAFSATLDIRGGGRGASYWWAATCPRCLRARMPTVSNAPIQLAVQ